GEALAAARAIKGEWWRAEALGALAPHLPAGLLGEALAAARAIEDAEKCAEALGALAPHLAELPRAQLYKSWAETLPILAQRRRRDLLADLRALTPVIAALGGEKAVAEAARAIADVGQWWP
ncbi:MAG: hypothetical protein ACK44M_11400, partial [Chloroflexus sp.]